MFLTVTPIRSILQETIDKGDIMTFKTIDELKTYAETMTCEETLQVGMRCSNHSRAVYMVGEVMILIDTVLPYNWFKPSQEWYWTGDNFPKAQAEEYAKKYDADATEAFYSDDEYMLTFDKLDNLLQWVFDHRKAQLEVALKNIA